MTVENVLVTGAGGFIGERLTHRIALGEDFAVTPLVHTASGPSVMRLARLPVEIEQGSILDHSRMAEVVADCDAVVHCAVGGKETTVEGTRIMLAVAEQEGVESFVHMSSASIHGHDFETTIDESAPFNPDNAYGKWKIQAERDIAEFDEQNNLSPTILRPFIVYGPHGVWVEKPYEMIKSGAVLTDGGSGTLNQIYVDNLVDAILLAITTPEANGETLLLGDDETVSWNRYYQELGAALPTHPRIKHVSATRMRVAKKGRYATDSVVLPIRAIKRILTSKETRQIVTDELERTPWVRSLFKRLSPEIQTALITTFYRETGPVVPATPDGNTAQEETGRRSSLPESTIMMMQSSTGTLSSEKAKEVLGWEQRISFEEAMELVVQWLEYEHRPLAGDLRPG